MRTSLERGNSAIRWIWERRRIMMSSHRAAARARLLRSRSTRASTRRGTRSFFSLPGGGYPVKPRPFFSSWSPRAKPEAFSLSPFQICASIHRFSGYRVSVIFSAIVTLVIYILHAFLPNGSKRKFSAKIDNEIFSG